ncbi:MAG: response regulator transcription factor [Verrucomicrobia bacterium]|nr:response regulator transcription factor [Verrucomicrobiota bacterium]
MRKGISMGLSRASGFEVVGEAGDGDAAIQAARDHSPDVVLLDIDLPGRNGLSVAEILRNELPDIKVVILSMFTSEGYVMQALKFGVQGCLPKGSSMDEVARAVQCVSDGDVYFSEGVARMALGRMVRNGQATPSPEDLTQREREVLVQIAEGLSNKEIASALNLGVRTVETHRDRLMRKLGIHSVAGLTKFAIRHGLSTLGSAVSA